jgi:hypothetical protein
MKRLLSLLAFAAIAGAAGFAAQACGGDEEEGEQPTATQPAGGEEPTKAPEGGGGEADLSDLKDVAGNLESATFRVTLKFSGDGAADLGEGEMTWYQKPPNTRFDISARSEGEEFSFVMINTPDASYMCTSFPGADGSCFKGETEDASNPFAGFTDIVEGIDEEITAGDVTVRTRTERKIAGVDAVCWEVESPEGSGTFCASESGIPLLIEITAPDGNFTLEATDVSTDVSDSDFEPPYEVTEGGPFGIPPGGGE